MVHLFGLPARLPYLGGLFRQSVMMLRHLVPALKPKISGLLEYAGSYPGAYFLRRGLYLPHELPSVVGHEMARDGLERLQAMHMIEASIDPDPGEPFGRVATMESSLYMRNQLLRDSDWASMAHSIELRVPLVDATLLKGLAPVLGTVLKTNDKKLLANAPLKRLPGEVALRGKTGFTIPVNECWLIVVL